MHLKLLACKVLQRMVWLCAARSPHSFDMEFTAKDAHNDSDQLRTILQQKIDASAQTDRRYDAVLLAYGLCGNATAGLQARTIPLVIPRAHDCCTLFLGDRRKFADYFKDQPSTPFSSAGYLEEGGTSLHPPSTTLWGEKNSFAEYVAAYGEENARYLWQVLSPARQNPTGKIVFIEVPELAHLGYAQKCRQQAEREGLIYEEVLGSIALIDALLQGKWSEKLFLVVPPGKKIQAVYDWEEIVRVG